MSSYIHFTEEQKQRAAAVDLEEFLRCRGEKLLSSGREKRLASDHSVTVRGNEWYDHAEERGGHAVSFVQRFYGLSYPDAVTMLLGSELGTAYPSAEERTEEPAKPFVLPPANKDMRRVFAYLIKHRGIARDVVAHFAKAGLLYEDAEYHNAVFVGTDVEGVPRHAHKRSANSYGKAFRLNVEGSDPRYSFHYVGTGRSLYVFEAPIDMLSFITLYPENWQRHSYGPPAPQTAHHSNIVSCSRSHCAPGAFLRFRAFSPHCRGPPFSRFASPPNLEKRRTENVVSQ